MRVTSCRASHTSCRKVFGFFGGIRFFPNVSFLLSRSVSVPARPERGKHTEGEETISKFLVADYSPVQISVLWNNHLQYVCRTFLLMYCHYIAYINGSYDSNKHLKTSNFIFTSSFHLIQVVKNSKKTTIIFNLNSWNQQSFELSFAAHLVVTLSSSVVHTLKPHTSRL